MLPRLLTFATHSNISSRPARHSYSARLDTLPWQLQILRLGNWRLSSICADRVGPILSCGRTTNFFLPKSVDRNDTIVHFRTIKTMTVSCMFLQQVSFPPCLNRRTVSISLLYWSLVAVSPVLPLFLTPRPEIKCGLHPPGL